MNLTAEQKQAVKNGEAVRFFEDGESLVVLRADIYDRIKNLFYDDSEWSDEEKMTLLAEMGRRAGWDDPKMDAYDNYDEELQKRCP